MTIFITKRLFQTSVAKAEGSLGITNAFMSLTPPVNKNVKVLTKKPYLGVLKSTIHIWRPIIWYLDLGRNQKWDFPRDKLS